MVAIAGHSNCHGINLIGQVETKQSLENFVKLNYASVKLGIPFDTALKSQQSTRVYGESVRHPSPLATST